MEVQHPGVASRTSARRGRLGGQMLAELAIVLPFLLMMLAVIVDFGYYLYDYISTQSSLHEAAVAAIQARGDDNGTAVYTDAQIKAIAARAHGPINPLLYTANGTAITADNEITITTTPADSAFDSHYASVTVYIDHNHSFLFPIFTFVKGGLGIRAKVRVARIPGLSP